ncbi:MAG: iron-siderophore ABC transporter substrate-binding protein [Actinomycetota bacterium]
MLPPVRTLLALLIVAAMTATACGDDSTAAGPEPATAPLDGPSDDTATAVENAGGSSDDTTVDEPEPDDDAPASETASEPFLVRHKLGETLVPADPQRIFSLGVSDQDMVLALGHVPVGITDWYGDQPYAVWPWSQELLGDAQPALLDGAEPNPEIIAATEPDLIIGVTAGLTDEQYGVVSEVAPTVAQAEGYSDWGAPWQVRARLIGEALGQLDEADALVAAAEQKLADVRAEYPEWEGLEAAVAFQFNSDPGAYTSTDIRPQILAEMGFVTPAEYDELAQNEFYVSFSEERIDLLDVDVIIWIVSDDAGMEAVLESPLRRLLPAANEGREVFASPILGGAFSFANPVSIPYLVDELVPEIALAVDGDPETKVPSAVAVGAVD